MNTTRTKNTLRSGLRIAGAALLGVIVTGCSGDGSGDVLTCTPSDAVALSVDLDAGCPNAASRVQVSDQYPEGIAVFELGSTVWGCSQWNCLGNGDEILYRWAPENFPFRFQSHVIGELNSGQIRLSVDDTADLLTVWTLDVFLNEQPVASVRFLVVSPPGS